jgi:hypothetical protein
MGAGWAFLLPSLNAAKVVCVGDPGDGHLSDLALFADSIVVWCRSPDERDRLSDRLDRLDLESVSVCLEAECAPPGWADVVLVAGRRGSLLLRRDPSLQEAVDRVLAADGAVWTEHDRSGPGEPGQVFWITPRIGPMQTAVPADEPVALDYFLNHGIDKTWATVEALRDLVRGGSRGMSVSPGAGSSAPAMSSAPGPARTVGRAFVAALQSIEKAGARVGPLRRRARLMSRLGPSNTGPPRYLQDLARSAGVDIGGYRWGLSAGGEYPSRKVVCFLLEPDSGRLSKLVKLTREPTFNHRLEIEHQGLVHLEKLGSDVGVDVPRALFFGHHRDRAILGQTALSGDPFNQRTRGTPDCPVSASVVAGLTKLGTVTARASREGTDEGVGRLRAFADRFVALYGPSEEHASFLLEQVRMLSANSTPCPVVFQHGDTHTGNILSSGPGSVGLVDWEASDPEGMPLWDVLHFLWAYIASSEGARNDRTQGRCFERHFFGDSEFHRMVLDAVAGYSRDVGIDTALIEPLFYTCWMHRAIRESIRLEPDRLDRGRYVGLLRMCIEGRQRQGLQRLFRAGA